MGEEINNNMKGGKNLQYKSHKQFEESQIFTFLFFETSSDMWIWKELILGIVINVWAKYS